MRNAHIQITWRELALILAILLTAAVIFLPLLGRARECARRASCPNNLKQWGLICQMFANESAGNTMPPVSPVVDNWIMDMNAVYPEYLNDPGLLVCPSSTFGVPGVFELKNNRRHPDTAVGSFHPDCAWSACYIYTGFALWSDEQALALANVYYGLPAEAIAQDIHTLIGALPKGVPESPEPWGPPIMWDRIEPDGQTAHQPAGANVLFGDGHVEYLRFSWYNPSKRFPATLVAAEVFGGVPTLSEDCY